MTKIEIDLEKLLGNREELILDITEVLKEQYSLVQDINRNIKDEINKIVKTELNNALSSIINQGMNETYIKCERFGDSKYETSIRSEITKACQEIAQFKQCHYSSDNNPFTALIIDTVHDEIVKFKKDYISKVNELFTQEALNYAVNSLKEKLSLKDK